MSEVTKSMLGYYGNTKLIREKCPECDEWSFVLDGYLVCCDVLSQELPTKMKRMSITESRRRLPPMKDRRRILDEQDNRCIYCLRTLGTRIIKDGRLVKLRLHWDHLIPYKMTQNNNSDNFAASCHLCNLVKGALVFDTVEAARIHVQARWEQNGWI